jgi:serine/threonine protein kinase
MVVDESKNLLTSLTSLVWLTYGDYLWLAGMISEILCATAQHIFRVFKRVYAFGDSLPGEKMEEKKARKIFQQLITAVRHCHNKGVAHR